MLYRILKPHGKNCWLYSISGFTSQPLSLHTKLVYSKNWHIYFIYIIRLHSLQISETPAGPVDPEDDVNVPGYRLKYCDPPSILWPAISCAMTRTTLFLAHHYPFSSYRFLLSLCNVFYQALHCKPWHETGQFSLKAGAHSLTRPNFYAFPSRVPSVKWQCIASVHVYGIFLHTRVFNGNVLPVLGSPL